MPDGEGEQIDDLLRIRTQEMGSQRVPTRFIGCLMRSGE